MKTILVIDDESSIRLLYRTELEAAGYNVIESGNFSDARNIINTSPPDLITLDIRLNDEIDGIQFLMELRRSGLSIPVIIITAYNQYQYDFKSWAADAFLVKSSDTRKLIDTVNGLLKNT